MKFDLNNLNTLDDYTNAGKHFILLFDSNLLKNDEIIYISVNSVYRAKLRLDQTHSINRYSYTKRSVFNSLKRYLSRQKHRYHLPDYIRIDTPLDILLKKESLLLIQDFIHTLNPLHQDCANLLCDGYSQTEISKKLKVSRQRIGQMILRIKKEYEQYVLEKEKISKKS